MSRVLVGRATALVYPSASELFRNMTLRLKKIQNTLTGAQPEPRDDSKGGWDGCHNLLPVHCTHTVRMRESHNMLTVKSERKTAALHTLYAVKPYAGMASFHDMLRCRSCTHGRRSPGS